MARLLSLRSWLPRDSPGTRGGPSRDSDCSSRGGSGALTRLSQESISRTLLDHPHRECQNGLVSLSPPGFPYRFSLDFGTAVRAHSLPSREWRGTPGSSGGGSLLATGLPTQHTVTRALPSVLHMVSLGA